MGIPPSILLAFEQKEEWSQVVPWLQEINSEKERMEVASGFATLYLWNEKLLDAREATDYWLQVSSAWVHEHPVEANNAVLIYQKSLIWYPYGFPSLYPADVLEQKSRFSSMKRETKILSQAKLLDQGIVMEWRDARLVSQLVDWVTGKRLTGEGIWEQPPRKEETSRFTMGYDSVHFPRFFVACAGISQSDFKRMWRKANSLDAIQTAARYEQI